MVAAQLAAGIDLRSAIALVPAAKRPAFMAVAAPYTLAGYTEPAYTAMLVLGVLASLPVAARLLNRAKPERIAAILTAVLAASLLAELLRM
ncbi:hypothetical protein [Hyperthermus butylicus]|uniref:Uncharacterized protein n=1 Tax=Hyperthermus butylicus (strain DSM 5456 / JCM 9403 / PLM1-5) TaxID=415426 RepID=A2BMV7_HYPBU|nr:hypothetical protein [Hyperthermus butylicus]ABM81318.1 hypothetical protein Hbut_1496 [Hyperthermus butylicus DSM 5456]